MNLANAFGGHPTSHKVDFTIEHSSMYISNKERNFLVKWMKILALHIDYFKWHRVDVHFKIEHTSMCLT